jgi:ATP-dependent RNA helicase RhlB
MTERHLTDKPFSSLDLPEVLLQGVRDAGFEYLTPIQAEALPYALAGQDVAGQAQTGTGKTAAFLLAAFTRLIRQAAADETRRPNQPRALILAPTRELAVQIHKDAQVLGGHTGFRLGLVYGGTGYEQQRRLLEEGVDVLIGTPGRLIDYYQQRVFDLKAVQVMVLDEADRMFDLGFIKDVRYLLRRLPPPAARLNMLFSATLSYRVTELAYEHMNNPVFVRIEPDKRTADKVQQRLYHTAMEEKIPLLVHLLRQHAPARALVFVNTKDMAETLSRWLAANGLRAAVLSGDVPQPQRLRLLADFTEGRLPILVATDVAARGLHIPDVTHVFNFDLPQHPEDYVHRIGRTARAGASGEAISFACEKYVFSLPEIEEYLGHRIPVERITEDMLPPLVEPQSPERRGERSRPPPRGERPARRGRRSGGGRKEARASSEDRAARPERAPAESAAAPARTRSAPVANTTDAEVEPRATAKPKPLWRRNQEKPAVG